MLDGRAKGLELDSRGDGNNSVSSYFLIPRNVKLGYRKSVDPFHVYSFGD